MNALTTIPFPGAKDPSSLVWPPTLPIELALNTATPDEIREEYGYTREEWDRLRTNKTFLTELAGACELVRQEGMSFKLKAKLIAEENLKQVWKMVHGDDKDVPAAVKGKLIELTARWAGFDPKTYADNGSSGPVNANTLNIQINLGSDY